VNNEEELLLMFLRLTFGGSPGPNKWSVLAKMICDLSNALLLDDNWDPATLASPSQHRVKSPNRDAEMDRVFGVGRELIVDIPIDHRGNIRSLPGRPHGLTLDMP